MTAPQPAAAARRPDRLPILLALGVVGCLLVLAAAGVRSWHDLAAQEAAIAESEQRIVAAEQRVAELRERIGRLKDDPVTLERLARSELGLARPDELVVVFTDTAVPPAPAAAASAPESAGLDR